MKEKNSVESDSEDSESVDELSDTVSPNNKFDSNDGGSLASSLVTEDIDEDENER